MASCQTVRVLFISFVFSCVLYRVHSSVYNIDHRGTVCTYFGDKRISQAEGNLINCTWYAGNSCCKRTEVTSVFNSMYRLYGASQSCKNQMNYIMCYFCSPQQNQWYNRTAHICASFCRSIYQTCLEAEYRGKQIGNAYKTGDEFCRAQRFQVVDGQDNCFQFDPNVFGTAVTATVMWPVNLVNLGVYLILVGTYKSVS